MKYKIKIEFEVDMELPSEQRSKIGKMCTKLIQLVKATYTIEDDKQILIKPYGLFNTLINKEVEKTVK